MMKRTEIIALKRQVLDEKNEAKKAMDFFQKEDIHATLYAVACAKLALINKILKGEK